MAKKRERLKTRPQKMGVYCKKCDHHDVTVIIFKSCPMCNSRGIVFTKLEKDTDYNYKFIEEEDG